jgi:hypothetical protein
MDDNILDYNEMDKLEDHLNIDGYYLEDIVELLLENNINHKVREIKRLEDDHGPLKSDDIQLGDKRYVIQVPVNKKLDVSDLVKIKIGSIDNSQEIRKVFFQESMDDNGLIDVLVYPEDWSDSDVKIVQKLLASKNIVLSKIEIAQIREKKGPKKKNSSEGMIKWALLLMIGPLLLYILISVLT